MADGWSEDRGSRRRPWLSVSTVAVSASLALTACTLSDRPAALDVAEIEPAAGDDAVSGSSLAWPEASSCAALVRDLAGLDAAMAGQLDPMTAPLVVTSLGSDALPIHADLPLAEVSPAAAGTANCAILVGSAVALPAAADVVLDRRTVHSAYPTGTKRRRNPEYQALERELSTAKRGAAAEVDVMRTGDPLLDLIGTVAGGIIGGIGAATKRGDIRAAETALAATPAFIEDPILTPYRYEVTLLEAERRLAVPVALFDRATGRAVETTIALAEQRRFAVADGRHAADVEPQHTADATPVTTAELAAWRRTKPSIATSMLVTHLAAAQATAHEEPRSLQATMARLATPAKAPTAAAEPRPARPSDGSPPGMPVELTAAVAALSATPEPASGPVSMPATRLAPGDVVRVGADGHAGFYVTPEHALVPAAALGYSSLVDIRYPDGMRAHGLVELVDETLGLALVYLPRRGAALPLQAKASAAPATTSEPGLPWRDGETVIGLFVTDPRTSDPRWIDSPTLDRFVARLDTL
jgi:hypothetical protein